MCVGFKNNHELIQYIVSGCFTESVSESIVEIASE